MMSTSTPISQVAKMTMPIISEQLRIVSVDPTYYRWERSEKLSCDSASWELMAKRLIHARFASRGHLWHKKSTKEISQASHQKKNDNHLICQKKIKRDSIDSASLSRIFQMKWQKKTSPGSQTSSEISGMIEQTVLRRSSSSLEVWMPIVLSHQI